MKELEQQWNVTINLVKESMTVDISGDAESIEGVKNVFKEIAQNKEIATQHLVVDNPFFIQALHAKNHQVHQDALDIVKKYRVRFNFQLKDGKYYEVSGESVSVSKAIEELIKYMKETIAKSTETTLDLKNLGIRILTDKSSRERKKLQRKHGVSIHSLTCTCHSL